ncbi:MAG: beta-glucanase, partial [Flavobacteriaceae bacterium]|nr:beta-glucanase [Bacteroidia bacterium]NNL60315.1 beta-glucanase [Flavobacteriaceae bacterium]
MRYLIALLLLVTSWPQFMLAQSFEENFEGTPVISTWYGDNCAINASLSNPEQNGINLSNTVMSYHDTGGQYANARFDVTSNFDLMQYSAFSLKVFVPSSGITGSSPNQISLKLQDGNLAEPWITQSEIIKPITLDTWQEVTFDFATDSYINLDGGS